MPSTLNALSKHHPLSTDQIEQFRHDGHILLRDVLDPSLIKAFAPLLEAAVTQHARNKSSIPMQQRSVYDQAFLQVMNLWETNPECVPFIFNRCLARIATELMGVSGVRLYHDQALFKEAGGGYTPWHTDQRYWPVSNNNNVTAWIPLCDIPLEKGPLEFSSGSQHILENRDLAISAESEAEINKMMTLKQLPISRQAFNLGDVSFHNGATFHRAGPNLSNDLRSVMTIIYVDKNMRMKISEQTSSDAARWCPGMQQGELMASPLNPILFTEA